MEVNGKVMEGRSHWKVRGEHQRMFNGRYSVQVVTPLKLLIMLKNYVLALKNIAKNVYVEKTYYIRKVGGGGGVKQSSKKKKRVLVSFPRSATPLGGHASVTVLVGEW